MARTELMSSKGLLSMLRESDPVILRFAASRLLTVVGEFWYEMSGELSLLETHQENDSLSLETRQLFALVVAHIYFHLGEYDESVNYALSAGDLFHNHERDIFTETILGRCFDIYVRAREEADAEKPVDPRLEDLFNSLATRWQKDNLSFSSCKELAGFFLRVRRLDLLEKLLSNHVSSSNSTQLLTYVLRMTQLHIRDMGFRRSVLELLVQIYSVTIAEVDYIFVCQCLIFLEDDEKMAELLKRLIQDKNTPMAYQLAIDLFEQCNQDFVKRVCDRLRVTESRTEGDEVAMVPAEGGEAESQSVPETKTMPIDEKLERILTGETSTFIYMKFLYYKCAADIYILNQTKKALSSRDDVAQLATIIANSFMYAGTTLDGFLRDNLQWVGKMRHWAMYTTTATIGVIHRGHTSDAMSILKQYLPNASNMSLYPFKESGSLYALGLIHSASSLGLEHEAVKYLRDSLHQYRENEIMVHGASMGVGLAAIGSQSEEIYDALFSCVTGMDAVAGEGAALAIGLVMMGSAKEDILETLMNHANDIQKEKIIRGLSMATALILMQRENEADKYIDCMLESQDHWVRLGGCFTIGLAYAGTGYTKVIERLLQLAVRDTSDEVRRGAVIMIGFVTVKDIDQCLSVTKAFLDSYSPHIRYGVAIALGIVACGTGNASVLDRLWSLKDDSSNFVRQGTYIALAMVLMQVSAKDVPRVAEFRQLLRNKIAARKDDICLKIGCILATGLLDSGGRNCVLSLHRDGHMLRRALVGMFIFVQYWYWFPYTLCVCMALQPTCIIGCNAALEMPSNYSVISAAPPAMFAVPQSILIEKKESKARNIQKAVLSTTAKDGKHKKRRSQISTAAGAAAPLDASVTSKEDEQKKKDDQATSEVLTNPCRVTTRQRAFIKQNTESRYQPLKENPFGIVVLRDTNPEEPETLVSSSDPKLCEVSPPEPFIWQ